MNVWRGEIGRGSGVNTTAGVVRITSTTITGEAAQRFERTEATAIKVRGDMDKTGITMILPSFCFPA